MIILFIAFTISKEACIAYKYSTCQAYDYFFTEKNISSIQNSQYSDIADISINEYGKSDLYLPIGESIICYFEDNSNVLQTYNINEKTFGSHTSYIFFESVQAEIRFNSKPSINIIFSSLKFQNFTKFSFSQSINSISFHSLTLLSSIIINSNTKLIGDHLIFVNTIIFQTSYLCEVSSISILIPRSNSRVELDLSPKGLSLIQAKYYQLNLDISNCNTSNLSFDFELSDGLTFTLSEAFNDYNSVPKFSFLIDNTITRYSLFIFNPSSYLSLNWPKIPEDQINNPKIIISPLYNYTNDNEDESIGLDNFVTLTLLLNHENVPLQISSTIHLFIYSHLTFINWPKTLSSNKTISYFLQNPLSSINIFQNEDPYLINLCYLPSLSIPCHNLIGSSYELYFASSQVNSVKFTFSKISIFINL